jgi:hypothetical protein
MDQINLIQAKGGQGTSVAACAVALRAAGEGRTVRLDGRDRDSLAAVLGTTGDGPVIPGLVLGDNNDDVCDLVVHDGRAPHGVSLLVTRPCYLALRRALHEGATSNACCVVAVTEPGRALDSDDIAAVLGLPVITTIPLRAEIARAVDAGVPPASPNRSPPPPARSSASHSPTPHGRWRDDERQRSTSSTPTSKPASPPSSALTNPNSP